MSDRYETQLLAALGAVAIRPPAAYLWFGRRVALAPGASLVAALAQRLHADFYGPGEPRPQRHRRVTAPSGEGAAFVRTLSQANCGRGSWQRWRVAALEEDAVAVVRPDGLRLLAPLDDCRVDGALADVRVPKELAGLSPGVIRALGDAPASRADEDLVRLCWNLAAAGAVTFVARVTYALNQAGVPFVLELLDDPARYGDRAAADLLLARAHFATAIVLLRPLLRALAAHLSDGAPALTKPLARGLAVAEEPGRGERFGEHRCRLLAEAIVAASEQGLRTTDERLAVVRERFDAAAISLKTPYLQPGSSDAYDAS